MQRNAPKNNFVALMFWTVIAGLYLPLGYLIFQAFLTNPYDWESGFTIHWLMKLIQSPSLWDPLMTSLRIALASALLSVTMGTLGALGLSRIKKEIPASLQMLIMLPVLLPEIITGISLLLFFLLCRIPLGELTLILAHASFSASFVYFIMREQFRKLDPQMAEAAEDLGAKPDEVFWKVTLPNIIPGVLGGGLLAFTMSFDDFLISFFTSGAGVTTLPLKIYSLMRMGISPELNVLSLFMIIISTTLVLLLVSKEQGRKWMLNA
jgi:spermidine/putrescine transport system permease protein